MSSNTELQFPQKDIQLRIQIFFLLQQITKRLMDSSNRFSCPFSNTINIILNTSATKFTATGKELSQSYNRLWQPIITCPDVRRSTPIPNANQIFTNSDPKIFLRPVASNFVSPPIAELQQRVQESLVRIRLFGQRGQRQRKGYVPGRIVELRA